MIAVSGFWNETYKKFKIWLLIECRRPYVRFLITSDPSYTWGVSSRRKGLLIKDKLFIGIQRKPSYI